MTLYLSYCKWLSESYKSYYLIELRNVIKKYGSVIAVDNVSFTIQKNETFGLIGTSGSGKTTTLKMINRLVEPDSGDIFISGENIIQKDAVTLRRNIGYIIQDTGLFPHYTIYENIAVVPKLLGWKYSEIEDRVHFLLDLVGLSNSIFHNRYPNELSGGQQQRVGIARALAADPPVILMDEPFGALDPITRQQIRDEFKELENKIRKTVVLVTHDVFEAFDLCNRIALINNGVIHQIGTPKELIFKPANEFCYNFFSSNRFFLELSVLKLKDLFPEIQQIKPDNKKRIKCIVTQSLLEIFEILEEVQDNVILQVMNNDGNSLGFINPTDLFRSFFNYTNKYSRFIKKR